MSLEYRLCAAWNTGRGYTTHGQRIAVWEVWAKRPDHERELIAYHMEDYDRTLSYDFMPMDQLRRPMPMEVRSYVMECYDFNKRETALYANEGYRHHIAMPTDKEFAKWSPVYL